MHNRPLMKGIVANNANASKHAPVAPLAGIPRLVPNHEKKQIHGTNSQENGVHHDPARESSKEWPDEWFIPKGHLAPLNIPAGQNISRPHGNTSGFAQTPMNNQWGKTTASPNNSSLRPHFVPPLKLPETRPI